MANTYTLIASTVLTGTQASVSFSSIPSTYTDLVLKISARSDRTGVVNTALRFVINGTSTGYSYTYLQGLSASASSGRSANDTSIGNFYVEGANATANAFNNIEFYIPSYTVSQNKPLSIFTATETNDTTNAYITSTANLWQNTAAISSVAINPTGSGVGFVSGSSFYLYGIKNS